MDINCIHTNVNCNKLNYALPDTDSKVPMDPFAHSRKHSLYHGYYMYVHIKYTTLMGKLFISQEYIVTCVD